MTTTLGTSGAVDSALRRAFSEASIRVAPSTKMTDVVAALSVMGVTAEHDDGMLLLRQGDTVFHTGQALRAFSSKPEHAAFFILDSTDPRQWPVDMKIAYIKKHGEVAWAKKIHGPVLEAGIRVLDANMSKSDYLKLTRAEKVQFITEYGVAAVGKVMAKGK